MIREFSDRFDFDPYGYSCLFKSIKKKLWYISEEIKKQNKPAILYLFGAGASYGDSDSKRMLPLSNELIEAIGELRVKISNYINTIEEENISNDYLKKINVNIKLPEKELLETLKASNEKIIRVLEDSRKFDSLDVYGKYLYCNSMQDELNDLKNVMDIYFSLLQQIPNLSEKYEPFFNNKYLNFLVSIGDRKERHYLPGTSKESSVIGYPSHVEFLSWNYDNMVEQSYVDVTNKKTPNLGNYLDVVKKPFVFHFNSMAGYYGKGKHAFYDN